jgi:methylmalonyl-CoA mutase C-terminal domain/subunit
MEIRKDPAEFAQNRSDSTASDNQQARRAPDIGRRRIRVLIAKAGLDGHDRGAKVVAAALRDAGMEVIYTGLRQTPEMIVEAAIQEDVDVIGISLLSGAHMTIFPKILTLMKEKGLTEVLLFGGGIIPEKDIKSLKELGVGELFTPGTLTTHIVSYVRSWKDSKEATQKQAK